MSHIDMPAGETTESLAIAFDAFEARTIERAARAYEGMENAFANAVLDFPFVFASQQTKHNAYKTLGKGTKKLDTANNILAAMVFAGRAVEKNVAAPHFDTPTDALRYVQSIPKNLIRERAARVLNFAHEVAVRAVKIRAVYLEAVMKPTEEEGEMAYRELAMPFVAAVLAEVKAKKEAKESEKTIGDKVVAYLDKQTDITPEDIIAILAKVNDMYAALIPTATLVTAPAEVKKAA